MIKVVPFIYNDDVDDLKITCVTTSIPSSPMPYNFKSTKDNENLIKEMGKRFELTESLNIKIIQSLLKEYLYFIEEDDSSDENFEEKFKNSYNDLTEEEKEKFETMAKNRKKWLANAKTIN